jgi:hypothetical protein
MACKVQYGLVYAIDMHHAVCSVVRYGTRYAAQQGFCAYRARMLLYGFWTHISHTSKVSFKLFSATQATSPGVKRRGVPQGDHARTINSTVLLDSAHQENQYK